MMQQEFHSVALLPIEHYKATQVQDNELRTLSELAERHSGYWKKLFDRVS
jgi:hypothetical protein